MKKYIKEIRLDKLRQRLKYKTSPRKALAELRINGIAAGPKRFYEPRRYHTECMSWNDLRHDKPVYYELILEQY